MKEKMATAKQGVAEYFEIDMPKGGFSSEALYVRFSTYAEVRLLSKSARLITGDIHPGLGVRTVTVQQPDEGTYFMEEPDAAEYYGAQVIDKLFSEFDQLNKLCGICGAECEKRALARDDGTDKCAKCVVDAQARKVVDFVTKGGRA